MWQNTYKSINIRVKFVYAQLNANKFMKESKFSSELLLDVPWRHSSVGSNFVYGMSVVFCYV